MTNTGSLDQARPVEVDVAGFKDVFDLNRGIQFFAGNPTISMWTETSVAGLMLGLSRMVGVERFNLACSREARAPSPSRTGELGLTKVLVDDAGQHVLS